MCKPVSPSIYVSITACFIPIRYSVYILILSTDKCCNCMYSNIILDELQTSIELWLKEVTVSSQHDVAYAVWIYAELVISKALIVCKNLQ